VLTENVISDFSHVNELRDLQRLPHHLKAREFVRLWTQKEAFTKLLGCGHTMEFSSIECSAVVACAGPDADSTPAVHFESFYVPVDHALYHASLAVEKSHSICGPVEIRLINVVGPGPSNTYPIAAVN
jgi:phosphopantetheinyl transferase